MTMGKSSPLDEQRPANPYTMNQKLSRDIQVVIVSPLS